MILRLLTLSAMMVSTTAAQTPSKQPISDTDLIEFAEQTDAVFKQLDVALKRNLIKDDGAWIKFREQVLPKIEKLNATSKSMEPIAARLKVGSVARDAMTLFNQMVFQRSRPEKISEFRDHCDKMIAERNEFLAPIIAARRKRFTHDFTDVTGKFHITAELLNTSSGVAELRKPDGKVIKMQLTKLSQEDRDWVEEMTR